MPACLPACFPSLIISNFWRHVIPEQWLNNRSQLFPPTCLWAHSTCRICMSLSLLWKTEQFWFHNLGYEDKSTPADSQKSVCPQGFFWLPDFHHWIWCFPWTQQGQHNVSSELLTWVVMQWQHFINANQCFKGFLRIPRWFIEDISNTASMWLYLPTVTFVTTSSRQLARASSPTWHIWKACKLLDNIHRGEVFLHNKLSYC